MNIIKSFYFIYILIILIKFTLNEEITVTATNELSAECKDGLYFIEIKVNFSSPFNEYYSFPLSLLSPPELLLKCFFNYNNNAILCYGNLYENKFDLEMGEFIILPNTFPKLDNIIWDYDSFVKNIYEREWIIKEDCLQANITNFLNNKWGLFFDIKEIYDNKCSYSINAEENKYIFKMKTNLVKGNLIEKKDNDLEIEFLEEIWVPLLINTRRGIFTKIDHFSFAFCSAEANKLKINFNNLKNERLDFDCYIPIPEGKLLVGAIKIEPFHDYLHMKIDEYENSENKIFDNIYFYINRTYEIIYNISEKPLVKQDYTSSIFDKRKDEEIDNNTSSDSNEEIKDNTNIINNEISQTDDEIKENEENKETNEIISENTEIKENEENKGTNIISNVDIPSYNESKGNENKETNIITNEITQSITKEKTEDNNKNNTNINNPKEYKEIMTYNYFIIGEQKKIYCPDKPIFVINDINKDVTLFSSEEKTYTIMLKGVLTNGLQEVGNKFFSIMEVYEDISFNLHLIDNLAEDEDDQKAKAVCNITAGTLFYKKTSIFCYAEKISEESKLTNNSDITLNFGLEKNRLYDDIIIRWPDEKKKIKHMYSYNIEGFSLVQTNYGCFNNEFYFYIYIFEIDNEADINFEIQMKNPVEPKAICKLHEPTILKCYFPLYQQKLEQNTLIDLPTNFTYYSEDENGNKVIFEVDDYEFDYEDFHIRVKETCGDYYIVGALKKAGLDYFKIFLIVLGIAAFAFIVFICFISYVYYKIKHRNRKGQYIRHIEEDINTNNNINNKFNVNKSEKEKKIELVSSRK